MMSKMHGLIFAYHSNPQLRELSQRRNTCSIPYAGRYRIVDFMLSNMVNAGVTDVGLIVHTSYQSLLDHVGSGKDWDLSRKWGGLRILPPFGYANKRWEGVYRGRMDALGGVYSYLEKIRQDYVVLAGGDIAVNLDLQEVLDHHLSTGADITAVSTPISRGEARHSCYFSLDEDNWVTDIRDRPAEASGDQSLEVYIMSRPLLMHLVEYCTAHNIPSFSHGILQAMGGKLKISAFRFNGYAAPLQTVAGYYTQSMDLLNPEIRSQLFDPTRTIRTKEHSTPSTYYGPDSRVVNSQVADGCIIEGEVTGSVLFRGVWVKKGAVVQNSILMQGTVIHQDAVLRYAIADKGVQVNQGRMLMGHETYPLAIAKDAVV